MIWIVAAGMVLLIFALAMYCCLVVASDADDAMEEYFAQKEKPSS